MAFDPRAATAALRSSWDDALSDLSVAPFLELVDGMERRFREVPMLKRRPKNKAKVFRIRDPAMRQVYNDKLEASGAAILCMQRLLYVILRLVKEAYPSSHDRLALRVLAALVRMNDLLPNRLVERQEEGILEYVDDVRRRVAACARGLVVCEMSVRDLVRG